MNEVKDVRTRTGESQDKFAKRFGVTGRTIQNWEAGQPMTKKAQKKLAEIAASLDTEQPPTEPQEWYIEVIASQQRTIERLTMLLYTKI